MYDVDQELLELKKRAKVNYRELGNIVQVPPNQLAQRVLGFARYQGMERATIISYLQQRIRESERSAA